MVLIICILKNLKKDIFNYGGNSEFYGLDYSDQLNKIKTGSSEFSKEKFQSEVFLLLIIITMKTL